jgi:hypothetical protein
VQHINAAQFNQMCRDAGLLEPHGKSHGHYHYQPRCLAGTRL